MIIIVGSCTEAWMGVLLTLKHLKSLSFVPCWRPGELSIYHAISLCPKGSCCNIKQEGLAGQLIALQAGRPSSYHSWGNILVQGTICFCCCFLFFVCLFLLTLKFLYWSMISWLLYNDVFTQRRPVQNDALHLDKFVTLCLLMEYWHYNTLTNNMDCFTLRAQGLGPFLSANGSMKATVSCFTWFQSTGSIWWWWQISLYSSK